MNTTTVDAASGIGSDGASATLHRKIGWAGDLVGIDGQGASMRHGVTGIDGQVEQDLLELDGVGLDPERQRVELEDDRNVFAYQTLEQGHEITNNPVKIQRDRVQHLLPAERQ